MRHPGAVVAGLLCLIQATVQAQSYNPDLWPVTSGDSIEAYLDARLFDDTAVPAGIEAVLDRQGNLAVVRCGEVPGLVESSAHVLDFAAGQAYHIRPAHSLASAAFSPDQSHIAAVLSAPCDGCLVIYSMVDGEARRIEGVQAVPGSVTWLNADRISYLPELDGKAAAEPVEVDLTQAETGRVFGNPAPGGNLQPEVYSCGGTNDDCICGMNNPYPCCDNGGNCTWWAWHAACCNWGVGCPGWGNAHSWLGNAQASGYPTTSTPTVGTSQMMQIRMTATCKGMRASRRCRRSTRRPRCRRGSRQPASRFAPAPARGSRSAEAQIHASAGCVRPPCQAA